MSAPVYLESVAPERNRFRAYSIVETRSLFGEPALYVTWGRLRSTPRSRLETFPSLTALEHRREGLVRTRMRNGYARAAA